jgi:hypothetical protein
MSSVEAPQVVPVGHSASLLQTVYFPAPVQVATQDTSVTRVPKGPAPPTVPQHTWFAPHWVAEVHAIGVSLLAQADRQE